jgi:iron complex outermembrane receptor protein
MYDSAGERQFQRRAPKPPSVAAAVRRACLAGGISATVFASAVYAADTTTASADEPELQEVVVTGSLIARPNAETAEAITILKADTLKEQGVQNVEQLLSTLTSANASINTSSAVGTTGSGGTFANLRGLGNSRTLVLLDGERLAPNAYNGAGVDLNGIPFSALDSVQVLREGASALYGTDAIAGVINFITKKNYEGATVQVNFDRAQDQGGNSGQADFTFGHGNLASDGYNLLITASYSKQGELQASQRPFAAYGFDPARGYSSTNFPGNWPGVVQDANGSLWQAGYPACTGNPELTTYFGDCQYRYSGATDLLPESHEVSGMVSFTKALPADNQVKVQYFYTQSEVRAFSGPNFYNFAVSPTSPYFPTAGQLTCDTFAGPCATPTPDLTDPILAIWSDPTNARYQGYLNVEQRLLLTFSGSNGGWDYTTDLNLSKNTNDSEIDGGIPNDNLLAPGGTISNLVNPFGPQTAAGQAFINSTYVEGPFALGEYERWSFGAHASHPLGDAFNAGTPATFAIGVDISGDHFAYATTPFNSIVQAATGITNTSVEGNRKIQAAFAELDVPIAKNLDLDISDRQDRYSDFGLTNNGKVTVRYQPLDILTFRGAASTGFRAPTLNNLYQPPSLAASSGGTMGEGNPFCSPGNYTAEWTPATCAAQGIGLYGGNKNLTPETSENFDLGLVISPIQDLGITLDFYRILLKNTISNVPYTAIYGNPTEFASYITTATAGPYAGTLTPTVSEASSCIPSYTAPTCGYINLESSNTGRITTNGIDVSIEYSQRTPIGTFHEDLEGTAVTQFLEQEYTGGPSLNLVGAQAIGGINPAFRWQHNLRLDWTSPTKFWGAGLGDRYWSGYIDQQVDGNGNQRLVGAYNLVDGFASVRPTDKLTVLFGIKNIFNTSPPYTNAPQNNFASGYNALIADPLLRNFYVNVKYTIF